MLMTVLKGEQATAQSKALIRLFKQMKDYIAAENAPNISAGMVALATQTSQNTRDIAEIATDVRTLSNKVERNDSPSPYRQCFFSAAMYASAYLDFVTPLRIT